MVICITQMLNFIFYIKHCIENHMFYIDKETFLSLFKGLKGGNFDPS